MRHRDRTSHISVLLAATICALLLLKPAVALGEIYPPFVVADVCPEPNDAIAAACMLGRPDAAGSTVSGLFHGPLDIDVYRFEVPPGGAQAHLSLTDLWQDGRLRLVEASTSQVLAESDSSGPSLGQLYAPHLINRFLDAGSYAVMVSSSPAAYQSGRAHSYTLRVALGPRLAASAGPGPAPSAANGYQLSLSIEPNDPSPFSLLTFTATLDPPFSDLFEFSWSVDGRPLSDGGPVIQLPNPSSGTHTVVVIARGVRPYPDPARAEMPPLLSATGVYSVR